MKIGEINVIFIHICAIRRTLYSSLEIGVNSEAKNQHLAALVYYVTCMAISVCSTGMKPSESERKRSKSRVCTLMLVEVVVDDCIFGICDYFSMEGT